MTIAGSDSGGNAGVQADLRAFHTFGVHGCTVFTALTAQNPFGVRSVILADPAFVGDQIDAVLETYGVMALKTGMLSDPAARETLADRLAGHPEIAKVIDPVMIATSGARLVSGETVDAIRRRLLPLATIVTPNLPEAGELAGEREGRDAISKRARELARRIYETYGTAGLVKGGHGDASSAVDVLCTGSDSFEEFSLPWVGEPISTHGTGCSLAAALAAELALGRSLPDAVRGAKSYVHDAIAGSYFVGPGCGVLGFATRSR